jgi:two-component system LytT family response regulator
MSAPVDLRALIVDDEEPARSRLRRMLAEVGGVHVIGEADSGAAAVESIGALQPDVVFLDVQMPRGDGFSVVETIGAREMPATIFVTAFDAHAIRAFESRAIDYLLKPVRDDRLRDAVDRVRVRSGSARSGRDVERVIARSPSRGWLERIIVRDGERQIPVPVERIDWIQADRNDVWIHVAGRPLLLRRSIGALVRRLDPAKFAYVNRSAIVRVAAVREIRPMSHGDYRLVVTDGSAVVWSRRFRARNPSLFG